MNDSRNSDGVKGGHTPGPWQVEQEAKWPWPIYITHGDEVVVQMNRHAYSTSQKSIADVMSGKHMGEHREKAAQVNARQVADAHLIAAAPELLEALRELLEAHTAMFPAAEQGVKAERAWFERRSKAEASARAALAKASAHR